MKNLTLVFTVILLIHTNIVCSFGQTGHQEIKNSAIQQDKNELEEIKRRFSQEYANILASNMWTLTHDYESSTEVDEVLKYLQAFFSALESKDAAKLNEIGAIKGFKEKFANHLKSKDGTVRGFAAIILGIAGDTAYAPQTAALLDERDKSFTEKYASPIVTYRGRAAVSLGILKAKKFTPKIAALLKSKNDYDRQGAITALGYLGAKEYARDIINLLLDKDLAHLDDDSPIYFLIETGIAKDYKKEIIEVMLSEFRTKTTETAAYALVHLEAKENARDVAKLLQSKFKKGFAAKVLALLDSKEHADEIAFLLSDESGLVKKDAALALGILKSKKHAPKVAELLTAKEDYVRYYAAVSLILMEYADYRKEAIPIIDKTHQSGAYLNDGDFHPLVLDKATEINSNFKKLLEQAKSQN